MAEDHHPIHRVSRNDDLNIRVRVRSPGDRMYRYTADVRISAEPDPTIDTTDPSAIANLPATAEEIYGTEIEHSSQQSKLMTLFAGTRDHASPLSLLREHEDTLLREIYKFTQYQWAPHIKHTIPAYLVGKSSPTTLLQFNNGRKGYDGYENYANYSQRIAHERENIVSHGFDDGFVSFARVGIVDFPPAEGRHVNMMPFIFGEKESLPEHLQCYFSMIEQCPYMKEDIGKVGYLTVHESYVDVGKTQRREGLHIESPGFFSDNECSTSFQPGLEHSWGMGMFYGPDSYDGGIFMASNQQGTSKVWNALVDSRKHGIVDRHGGCEHLRDLLGEGVLLEEGELIWMTDLTPHEALPQKESGTRQFFRVVTPSITHWYKNHSTENPNVPLPSNVIVVAGNKFGELYDEDKDTALATILADHEQDKVYDQFYHNIM